MEPILDVRALYTASAVVFAGLTTATLLAWRELRNTAGLERFAASFAFVVAGTLLLSLRGVVPDLLSIVVANVLLVLGAASIQEGTRLFYAARPQRGQTLASAVASAAVFAWFTYVDSSSAARSAFSSTLLAVHLGQAAGTAWRGRGRPAEGLLDRVTSVALASCAAGFGVRAWAVVRGMGGDPFAGDAATVLALLLGLLASIVWTTTVLTNANRRLTTEITAQRELSANLLELARVAAGGPSLEVTLAHTLELARSLTGATGSSLLMVDERGAFSRGLYTVGSEALVVEPSDAESLLESGLAGWVIRHGESALVSETRDDPRWLHLDGQRAAIRSALAVPISGGRVSTGVLTLVHNEPGRFSPEQRRLVESAGVQIALVLRNAQIADARLLATRRQALLNRVLRVSTQRLDPERMAEEAADVVAEQTDWYHVGVALPAGDGSFRVMGARAGPDSKGPRVEAGVVGRAYASGRTQLVPDVRRDPDYLSFSPEVRSELAVPLRRGYRTLGILNLESPRPDGFSAQDVALAEAVAEALVLGLENAVLWRAREELTASMVHDLRAPMVSVMGALTLLGRVSGLTPDAHKLLDMARRNADRQARLIEAILEIARLEDGALSVERSCVDLAGLASEVVRLMEPLAAARQIELRCQVVPAEVWVDPGLIRRVLENLVGNAIKFSPDGAGPVTVSVEADVGDGSRLRVADSGPGIDPALRPRLFRRFSRGEQTQRGSGLGLAFCRLACEANAGRIWCEDSAVGAVFVISLPARVAASPEAPKVAE